MPDICKEQVIYEVFFHTSFVGVVCPGVSCMGIYTERFLFVNVKDPPNKFFFGKSFKNKPSGY